MFYNFHEQTLISNNYNKYSMELAPCGAFVQYQ